MVRGVCAGAVIFACLGAATAQAAAVMSFPGNKSVPPSGVLSYSFDKSAPPLAKQCKGAQNSGSVTIVKYTDGASASVADAAKTHKRATVQVDEEGADRKHLVMQFLNATVASITPGSVAAGAIQRATESVSFTYSKVQWTKLGCTQADLAGAGKPPPPF